MLPRRGLLTLGSAVLTAAFTPGPARAAPAPRSDPFTLGVASGDPLPQGVVLWTRLARGRWSRPVACRPPTTR